MHYARAPLLLREWEMNDAGFLSVPLTLHRHSRAQRRNLAAGTVISFDGVCKSGHNHDRDDHSASQKGQNSYGDSHEADLRSPGLTG